jgi:D-beta-D-heptose 7-phosphate kinase/D-beta-D-heptose 1-phosphate adenosyltransferase
MGRIVDRAQAAAIRAEARREGRSVVFTNGCFDLIHRGHVDLLRAAHEKGDLLVVGLNTDGSVRKLKGQGRPWVPQEDRAAVLAALEAVDLVVLFSEETPIDLIEKLLPDVLVKGEDYGPEEVVGADAVVAAGGRVELVPLTQGRSTSALIRKLKQSRSPGSDPA